MLEFNSRDQYTEIQYLHTNPNVITLADTMTYIDTDITDVWINMPTTTDRAVSVNANKIFSDMLPFSLMQLQLGVILNARGD